MALTFYRGRLGGGGYVTDIDISPDGLSRLLRTDVYGCYIWNSTTSLWQQLITRTSMPSGENIMGATDKAGSYGCYEIRSAPSNSAILYAVFPATNAPSVSTVYKSTDRGATWAQTSYTPSVMEVPGSPGRLFGPKLAIHPTDPDHVIVGNTAGVFHRTTDGGTNWATVTAPSEANPVVCFDPSDTTKVYIAWNAGTNRVYRSTDTGASFSQMTGGPDTVKRMKAAADGTIYLTDGGGGNTNCWKLSGTTFTNFATSHGDGFHSVACDPTDAARVSFMTDGGAISTTTDSGSTFTGTFASAGIRVATDVPWLAWTDEDYMSNGGCAYDPIVAGRLWVAEGIGVWYCTPPASNTQPTFTSQTAGNDELIVNDAIFPPGKKPLLSVQDRGVFRISDPTAYPSTHGPGNSYSLQFGWGLDYASSDSDFIAMAMYGGAGAHYSTDAGVNWTPFASQSPVASTGAGGCMAALTPSNIVWAPSNNGRPYYTTDGGANWTLCTFPGDVPTSGEIGFGFSFYGNQKYLAADRVASTFYAFNYMTGDMYKSTDSGANFTKTADAVTIAGGPGSGVGTSQRLQTVPGQSGHLFFTLGTRAGPHPLANALMKRSTDAGATWSNVAGAQEVWALGFGKEAPGESYPTIMIAGYANGDSTPGIYTSIDNCDTWVLQTNAPDNSLDTPRAIAGDMDTYGSFYIGLSSSGFVYSTLGTVSGTCFGLQF